MSDSLSNKDQWSILKKFVTPNSNSSIPPLEYDNNVYADGTDKANIFNNYFQSQAILDETRAVLPDLMPFVINSEFKTIFLTPLEVESVLKILTVGPNGLNNRILKEFSSELSFPFCSLFNQSLQGGNLPVSYKEANVCPIPEKGDLSVVFNHQTHIFAECRGQSF